MIATKTGIARNGVVYAGLFVCFVSFVDLRGAAIDADVDPIFARWNTLTTPGCAVAAAVDGNPVLAKGYGMADLERDVNITPETIFEAGSVSKQFTAAAVLLLARDGKLSIDDPVRKYIPELPDYHVPLTIRHLLTHTSGLRDWGSVEEIAGWPRTSRVYTHAHVLDIVSRQKELNFAPGTRWSYSNTGYNLAAMIVSRVSGESFADFTRERIFEPARMVHTSWRDDHTRVVKQRALAYVERDREFHTDMPFEDVFGNGGLLTTVGDLLQWDEHFAAPRVGDAAFVALQQQPATFTDGRPVGYAFGLFVANADGIRIIEHSGSTAGYRAHLLRMPDQRVSVAVLCNAATARATNYAHEVADRLLATHPNTVPADPPALEDVPTSGSATVWRNVDNGLVIARAPAGSTWSIGGDRLIVTDRYAVRQVFARVAKAHPSATDLEAFAGTYTSDEAEARLTVRVDRRLLTIGRRPAAAFTLQPLYADAFSAPEFGTVIFRRDPNGRVAAMSVVADRVWDLRFARVDDRPGRSSSDQPRAR